MNRAGHACDGGRPKESLQIDGQVEPFVPKLRGLVALRNSTKPILTEPKSADLSGDGNGDEMIDGGMIAKNGRKSMINDPGNPCGRKAVP